MDTRVLSLPAITLMDAIRCVVADHAPYLKRVTDVVVRRLDQAVRDKWAT
jgi:hypothetical protein